VSKPTKEMMEKAQKDADGFRAGMLVKDLELSDVKKLCLKENIVCDFQIIRYNALSSASPVKVSREEAGKLVDAIRDRSSDYGGMSFYRDYAIDAIVKLLEDSR